MNQPIFTYNQELATQIGGGMPYVSGGYDLKIIRAQFVDGKFLEMDFDEREGRKFQYVSINYTKNNGEPNEFGAKMINAIMGCVGAQQLTQDQNGNIPELFNKGLKGILQRIDYTKQSGANVGQDGFKFEFKMPANIKTGQTVKEFVSGQPAVAFAKYAESIEDKDERGANTQATYTAQPNKAQAQPSADFDDDIPF